MKSYYNTEPETRTASPDEIPPKGGTKMAAVPIKDTFTLNADEVPPPSPTTESHKHK